jgi:glycosyltransferase involved in cell wall biosynthesis
MRVAFVVQRYGEAVIGGAETECRRVAQLVGAEADVEILTSCASDYVTWKDVYEPGVEQDGTVQVRRFSVPEPRDIDAFNRFSEDLLARSAPLHEQERWARMQGPYMPDLLEWLERESGRYDVVVFFSYDYAHTYFGAPLVRTPKVIVPLAHDNWVIRLDCYRRTFVGAQGAVFNTPEERALCRRYLGDLPEHTALISVGCETDIEPDAQRFWSKHRDRIGSRAMVCYVGRVDESKGCGELIRHMERYRSERASSDVALVLAGPRVMHLPSYPWLHYLGFVDDRTKYDVFAASVAHVVPSPNESLSIAALEGWLAGRPLLANGRCEVLAGQCRRSNGGLYYTSFEEFREALDLLLTNEELSRRMGDLGRRFTRANYRWESVAQRWLALLDSVVAGAGATSRQVAVT